uniref:kininogen-1 n=1 Tax=Euleptes europaea TaxID=460621 RepID=UPI002541CE33|nr:kininogen-1 [Euleptes europaea]
MEVFILLVLSFCCCRAGPVPAEEEDCNAPDVFNAVDLALQKFNRERAFGNQFALVVVTEARRTAGLRPGVSFLVVKYKIRETICAIGGGIPWQNCDFRGHFEADSGECNAQIFIDNFINFSNVSQECRVIPAEGKVTATRVTCTGCWSALATDSLELLPLVRLTIRRFNNQDYHSSLFEVLEITQAQRQVVAGWNYAFEYLLQETNCSKAEFPDLTPACKRIPEGRLGKCIANAHINITNGLSYAVQECALQVVNSTSHLRGDMLDINGFQEDVVSPVRSCPGCPKRLATNSTELEKPLRAALEKYNSESNNEAYYKVEQILKAEVQIVAGTKYNIAFDIVKTNCSKVDFQELNEDCSAEENGYAAWPPGMTPFRSLLVRNGLSSPLMKSEGMARNRTAGNHLPGSRRGLGAAPSRGLGRRQGQGQTKDAISPKRVARALEDPPSPAKPCQQEEEPNEGGAGCPASPDFSMLDLLPESDAPKCPGKPWKPIIAVPTIDPEPVAEQQEEASSPATQDFNLADALFNN